jgi:outer membrane protein TolC
MNTPLTRTRTITGLALAMCLAGAAHAEAPLGEQQVVALALDNQPALKMALTDLETARWSVIGERARYAPTVKLDGSYTRNAIPQLTRGSSVPNLSGGTTMIPPGVLTTIQQRVDTGAELRKQLVFGTQLSLRVASYWLKSQSSNPYVGAAGVGGSFIQGGTLGPGWGVLTKLQLTQPLLRGRGREVGEAELRAALAQRTTAQEARDRVASELLRDVLTAYWELWYADRNLQIEQQALAVAERQRDEAQARVSSGTLPAADVLSFETGVAQRQEALLTARTDRVQREHELRRLLGMVENPKAMSVLAEDARIPEPMAVADAEREALAGSRHLRELRSRLELARIQARTADDPLRSRLDFDSYVQVQGLGNQDRSDALQQYAGFEAVSAFVGLTYEAPLDTRARRAAAAKARLAVEGAEAELAQARDQELSDLRIALERQAAERERLALVEGTVAIAERQLQAEEARYATGTSTSLAVLEAEDAVRSARLRVARSHADLLEISLSLEHATGRLLSRYATDLPVR